MKMSWACTGMLSSENDDFKILKTVQKHKMHVIITCTIVPGLVELFYLSKPVLSLTRNMNLKVAIELYYIFSQISKLK